jgi:hypothetical protein
LVELFLFETRQLWNLAARVFPIYFYQTGNEELSLFVGLCLPVVGLAEGDQEASITSPFSIVLVHLWPGERFDVAQVIQVPCFAN